MKTRGTPGGTRSYAEEHRQRKKWLTVVACLAALVVFCTVYALVMPAAALEGDTAYCGKAEHTHTEECYESVLTCGLEEGAEHVHDDNCYEQKLICGETEHVHTDACFAEPVTETAAGEDAETETDANAGTEAAALPDGAQVPENYTEQYTVRDDENGFAVTVYAPEGTVPDGAVLSAELLAEDDAAYAEAEEALAANTDEVQSEDSDTSNTDYGFAAMDIHFTDADGNEVEPNGDVYVVIDAVGLLPEGADPESITVQHHAERDNGEVTVETVADTADETDGVVAAQAAENSENSGVQAAFEVSGFSTFTIRWNNNNSLQITVNYVDRSGSQINGPQKGTVDVNADEWINLESYGSEIEGYTYQEARLNSYNNGTVAKWIEYMSTGQNRWRYSDTEQAPNGNGEQWGASYGGSRSIYLIYEKNETVNTVDTISRGVDISLYDYPENINGNISTNSSNQFAFSGGSTGFNSNVSENKWWNHWTQTSGGVSQGIVRNLLTNSGYPQLSSGINSRDGSGDLGYLFGGSSDSSYGIKAYEGLNYLFQYDATTGYYTYDSSKNFATIYDANGKYNDGKFIVYSDPNSGTSSGSTGHPYFLPFNQPGTNEKSGADYHFGMKITVDDFLMPRDGKINNQDMTFSFAGDDDVWVYIDGVLILDMGGIHDSNSGNINFGTGIVTVGKVYYEDGESKNDRQSTAYIGDLLYAAKSSDQEWISANLEQRTTGSETHWYLKDYTTHDLSFFYLERGAVDSNCKIEFNLYTLQRNSITVGKELDTTTETTEEMNNWLGNLEYTFRVLKEDAKANTIDTNDLFIAPNTTFDIYDENNHDTGEGGTVGADGTFTLKAGQYALFTNIPENKGGYYVQELIESEYSEQFGSVIVSVSTQGGSNFNIENGITVDEKKFDGVISNVQNASSAGYIIFKNVVDTEKLSLLTITKTGREGSDFKNGQTFSIYVEIDGEAVNGTFGSGDNAVTFENGNASFGIGTTVSIPVLTGAEFSIYEVDGSDYRVAYNAKQSFTGDIEGTYTLTQSTNENDEKVVSGEVGDIANTEGAPENVDDATNATMAVTLTNSSYDFNVSLPIVKELDGWNAGDENRTFEFDLVQVDEDGNSTDSTEGISVVIPSITIGDSNTNNGTAYINFDDSVAIGTYHFKVSEDSTSPIIGVSYDKSYYLVTIKVSEELGMKSAVISDVDKYGSDGKMVNNYVWNADESSLLFNNSLNTNVSIKKVDSSHQDTTLTGATFKLYYLDENEVKQYYCENGDGDTKRISWVADENSATTLTSGAGGLLTFEDLRMDRTYYLVEITAPNGYNLLEHEIVITWNNGEGLSAYYVAETGSTTNKLNTDGNTVIVPNSTGAVLPSTGGPGTTCVTIGGLLLMAAAVGGGYGLRRRRGKEGR